MNLSLSSQQNWSSLADALRRPAHCNNGYFCLCDDLDKLRQWLEQENQVLLFDAAQREMLQQALTVFEKFQGNVLMVVGLESHQNPQGFLAKLAPIKQKRCPDKFFHWLIHVTPAIEEEFRGLQSFLDGKAAWFDLRLQLKEIETITESFWHGLWQNAETKSTEQREALKEDFAIFLDSLNGSQAIATADPMSILMAKLRLLQGLLLESQGDTERRLARDYYQESFEIWQLLGEEDPQIWTALRLAYLWLIDAYSERDRGHPWWQDCQNFVDFALEKLQACQWRFFYGDTLPLLGQVLRGLNNWEQLRQAAENSLIVFYQLSPFSPTETTPQPSAEQPWSNEQLQALTANAYALLAEALLEQWKFDEAEEALKRAFEVGSKEARLTATFLARLHYLSGRIQLANDQVPAATKILKRLSIQLDFADDPQLYLEILIKLRECYRQLELWGQVLSLDQTYQQWEYRSGQRAFVGLAPLPCWPHRCQQIHWLVPERLLGGVTLEPTEGYQTPPLSLKWSTVTQAWQSGGQAILVLAGESGTGKTSWLESELRDQLPGSQSLIIPFDYQWAETLLAELQRYFPGLESQLTEESGESDAFPSLEVLQNFVVDGIWLVLDGRNGDLPWQHPYADPSELAEPLWSWLVHQVTTESLRLVISLPPTAIADLQTTLTQALPHQQSLPPLVVQSFPLLSLDVAEATFNTLMTWVPHPWSPSLVSQVLGELAMESVVGQQLWIHPLDLQLLGTELEAQGITQSVDYQQDKFYEWFWQTIQRQLKFLPASLQQQAISIGRSLTHPLALHSPKPISQLEQDCLPTAGRQETTIPLEKLLELLVQARLLSVSFLANTSYYRLTTDHLAQAFLQSFPETEESISGILSNTGMSSGFTAPNFPSAHQVFQNPQKQTQELLTELAAGNASTDEQEASQRLQAAERQYRRTLAGVSLERHSWVVLRQFDNHLDNHPLDALIAAVQTGHELQEWVDPETSLVGYPSLAPLLTLQNILANIYELNRLQHRTSVTCIQISAAVDNLPPLLLTATTSGKARIWSMQGPLLATLRGHQAAITTVEWSRDGKYILTASADHTVKLWNRQGEILTTLRGHSDWVRSAHFNPRFEYIVTSSRDGTIRLWNYAGEQLSQCVGHSNWIRNAEFDPTGQLILSSSRDGTARLWDLEGRERVVLQGHTSWVRNAQFSPNGQWIATASADGTARVWNQQGQSLSVLKGHHNWVRNALWSPDGQMVVTCSSDGTARVWSAKGRCLAILSGHNHSVHDARFSPDGQMVVTCSSDGTARVWSRGGNLAAVLKGHQKDVFQAQFSEDSQQLYTVSADHTARIWNLAPKPGVTLSGHGHWVRHAHFNPKGDRLLTVSRDKTARIWDLQGNSLCLLEGHQGWVREGVFSSDGELIATASADKTVQLWNVLGKKLATLRGHQAAVLNVRFSPNGQYILTASKDATARVWNTTGQELATLRLHEKTVFSAEFSQDGQFIITASDDHTARIWDIVGREVGVCKGHSASVYEAQFSPDNQYILTASADHTTRLWNILGQSMTTLEGHQNVIYQAEFSPDSELIVTAAADKTARIWDQDGECLAVLYGHQGLVSTAKWSPDSQLIVTTSNDGTARIWDRLGRELATLEGHYSWVRAAEFSPDGHLVLTASTDGTARLWLIEGLERLLERGRQWLEPYLLHNPLVTPQERALALHHPTLDDKDTNNSSVLSQLEQAPLE